MKVLRLRIPLFCGGTKPPDSRYIVLRDAFAGGVRHTQAVLGERIPVFCGSTKRCSGVIRFLRDAFKRDC